MASNLDRFKDDLAALIKRGDSLALAIDYECSPQKYKKAWGDEAADIVKMLPSFRADYQSWYTEAHSLIKQVIPDRLADFVRHYEKPKSRKDITNESYRIEDYLQGIAVKNMATGQDLVPQSAAIPHFEQQRAIVRSAETRFSSSLLNMAQLVQADLFDSELEAASALAKQKFTRAAGALAGVVLEKHLDQVLANHNIKLRKKNLGISYFNDALKDADVLDVPAWRSIQVLADIRNLCDHNKKVEPTKEQVDELIAGVEKVTRTLF